MGYASLTDWINKPSNNKILSSFSTPKTPTRAKNELGVGKFSLKPLLKRRLIKCLNPEGHKGKLYVVTNKAAGLLGIPRPVIKKHIDYNLLGQIIGSPKQNYVVLKMLLFNSGKYTSEEIRQKSKSQNACLSRISTKSILKDLICMELVECEMSTDRKRYYWITEEGRLLASELY